MKKSMIRPIKWQKIVYVKEAPLMLDCVSRRHARTDRILDDHYRNPEQTYLYLDGDIYYGENEVKAYDRLVRENLKDLNKILGLIKSIGDRFVKKESRFNTMTLRKKSDWEIIDILKKYSIDYENALSTLYIPVGIDLVLSELLRNYLKKKFPRDRFKLFNALTPLIKDVDTVRYHKGLLQIALEKNKLSKKKLQNKLAKLVEKNRFLGIKFYFGKPSDWKTVIAHLKEIDDPQTEIKNKAVVKKEEWKAYQDAMQKLRPGKKIKNYIKWLRETIYLRTYRLERICEGENNSFVLLEEIGRRLRIDGRKLIYFRFHEIEAALLGKFKITKALITERSGPYGMISENKIAKFYFGKDYLPFKKKYDTVASHTKLVRGQVAYQGYVKGRVRLIAGDHEINKLKRGEILVTRMTTPDYIFAMQKSVAIVTDVGGVTSHASVISRELRKPCIIGTKIATKVFQDGDLVEVDANKGMVRKLTK